MYFLIFKAPSKPYFQKALCHVQGSVEMEACLKNIFLCLFFITFHLTLILKLIRIKNTAGKSCNITNEIWIDTVSEDLVF